MPALTMPRTAALVLAAAALPAAAQSLTQHVDAHLYEENGKLAVGINTFNPFPIGVFQPDARLFSETLDSIGNNVYAVSGPGFFSSPSRPLPANAFVTFNVPAIDHPFAGHFANAAYTVDAHNLLYWDGLDDDSDGDLLDDVAFSTPAAGDTFVVFLSDFVFTSLDGSANPAAGFLLEQANADGAIHRHVDFEAYGPGGFNAPIGTYAQDGHYLVPMVLSALDGGGNKIIDDSDTLYLHFSADYDRDGNGNFQFNGIVPITDAAADAAAQQWVQDYLIRTLGDFDDSAALDVADLEGLFDQQGLADPAFGYDLTGDGQVTTADLDRWILELAGTAYADANLDLKVDTSDLAILAAGFGTIGDAAWGTGDFNGDGNVDTSDLAILAAGFGFDASAPVLAAAVPEPATLGVVGLGLISLARRRRR
ncbi:MAG: PEP-CTERM sorting domain-containing protein [Planctomycetota bacterium]